MEYRGYISANPMAFISFDLLKWNIEMRNVSGDCFWDDRRVPMCVNTWRFYPQFFHFSNFFLEKQEFYLTFVLIVVAQGD